jgi:hypothetical protein
MDKSTLDYVKDLPGFERGHPHYFRDPMLDHLLEIVMLLGGELWVERDRRMISEHIMDTEGSVTRERIEQFVPDAEFAAKLDSARQKFTNRVYGCLYEEGNHTDVNEYFDVIGKDNEA